MFPRRLRAPAVALLIAAALQWAATPWFDIVWWPQSGCAMPAHGGRLCVGYQPGEIDTEWYNGRTRPTPPLMRRGDPNMPARLPVVIDCHLALSPFDAGCLS